MDICYENRYEKCLSNASLIYDITMTLEQLFQFSDSW